MAESDGLQLNTTRFVKELQPAFENGDLRWAYEILHEAWPVGWLIQLLIEGDAQAKRLAIMSLGLVGDGTAVGPLTRTLHDQDPKVIQLADNSLRCIWCGMGKKQSSQLIKQGNSHLNHGNTEAAIERFSMAIETDPEFAEAYNQRAIAYCLADRFEEAIADYQATLKLEPLHFVAMANLGHCYCNLGDFSCARHYYEQALAINPHLEGVAGAIDMIDRINDAHDKVA
ncbi:MAG: tetratricopeptide repeat protein [Phycisphaerae bacterium]|nr:tetratricopeptide repeat protein [Phycisphaerae bacterium]